MNSEFRERRRQTRQKVEQKYVLFRDRAIGQGTYGVVYKATSIDPTDKNEYAVKKFKTIEQSDGLSQSACREINLCRELSHENIVALKEVLLDPEERTIYMVFQYAEHDLLQIIEWHQKQKEPLAARSVKSIIWQILNGVCYLHSNWVLHRDLKPANILLMGEGPERGFVKIADLGLARLFQSPLQPLVQADRVVVTIWYRSPELLLGAKHYTKSVDIWSIGCIFAELLLGQNLFKGKEVKPDRNNRAPFQRDQLEKIFEHLGMPDRKSWPFKDLPEEPQLASFKNKYDNHLDSVMDKKTTPEGFKLLKCMLDYNPLERISAEDAMQHRFFEEDPKPRMNALEKDYPKRNVELESLPDAAGNPGAMVSGANAIPGHGMMPQGPPGPGAGTKNPRNTASQRSTAAAGNAPKRARKNAKSTGKTAAGGAM